MWKVLRDSAQGTSHKSTDVPCQDAELACSAFLNDEETLFVCCADGAGSAAQSHIGSTLSCNRLWHCVERKLQSGTPISQLRKDDVVAWYTEIASEIKIEAEKLGVTDRDLACTLLGGVIGENAAIFFQIGDGGIVIKDQDIFRPVFWPQSGEYINETNFVTDKNLSLEIDFEKVESRIDYIGAFTDGLQPLVLDYAQKKAHGPFFDQMFTTMKNDNLEDLYVPFKGFLNSCQINDRTDDDKTLILALRATKDVPSIL